MKIKIKARHNLFYPLMIVIFLFFREVDTIVMSSIGFNGSLLIIFIMFLSEIISGLFFFLYYKEKLPKRGSKLLKQKKIKGEYKAPDSTLKIYILIIMMAYFDFMEFILQTYYFPKFSNISISLIKRVRSSLIISDAILCYFLLRLAIYKHQKLSLIIIFTCFIIVIVSEYFFEQHLKEGNGINYIKVLLLLILNYIFNSFLDVISKYLLEFDNINPYKLLMLKGIFGFILTFIYSINEDSFKEIKAIYEKNNFNYLIIVCLLIYLFTCGGRTIYDILTIKLYSPMARALSDSVLDPLFLIYYYFIDKDFNDSKSTQNIFYFIVNLIISNIIVFFGCVYNELFILYCCNLQYETYHQISIRALDLKTDINNSSLSSELACYNDDNYFTVF